MIRRLAALACLAAAAIAAGPTASSLGLEAETSSSARADGAVAADGLDAGVSVEAEQGSSARVATDETSPGLPEAPSDAQSADDAPGPWAASAAVPQAAAAAGTVVLLAMAAYYWSQLKILGAGFLMPLFSRIQPNRVLDNEVRNRIHAAVSENPGVTIKEIVGVCAVGWGTAVYHLKRLEAERLIVSERHRQFRRYFRNGGGIANGSKSAYGELKNPTGHRIAATILSQPGQCQKEVCQAVGISPPLAHKYLARLEGAGLVQVQREWKTAKYFPTPQLQNLFGTMHTAPPASAPLAVAA